MTNTQPLVSKHNQRLQQLAQARKRILSLPADKAMDAILDHPQPAALVHSFPEQDLFFLIHDAGPEEALPLISLASNRQWEYFLDIQGWDRDQVDYPKVTAWLELLLQADARRLVDWCFGDKLEFLELFLFRNIEVRVRETEESPSDFGEGFFSDDDTYYVRLVDYPTTTPEEESAKAGRNATLHHLLKRLSTFDHVRYQGLLAEAVHMIPAEAEEELFRLRNVRLAEKGFLPFHEAVGVYQPLAPEDLDGKPLKIVRRGTGKEIGISPPQLAATFLEEDNLFVRALKGISDPLIIEQLQGELAGLCNQVISADQDTIVNRGQLQGIVAKTSGYVSIGIECLTQADPDNREARASHLVQRHLLADLFRVGIAGALQLHWDALKWRKTSWFQTQRLPLTFWGEAWLGLLGGLLVDRPKHYDPSIPGTNYRDFRTLGEIRATHDGFNRITNLDQIMGDMQISLQGLTNTRFLTYKNVLLTLWARSRLDLAPLDPKASTIAIPIAEFISFYKALWRDEGGRRFIEDAQKNTFLQWIAEASGREAEHLSRTFGMFFEAMFNEIEMELGPVKSGNLEPRYVRLFLLKP